MKPLAVRIRAIEGLILINSESESVSCSVMYNSLWPHGLDCSPQGSSVHGILQARILEWVAISFSRGSSGTQGLKLGLLNCRQIPYHLSHQGSPFVSLACVNNNPGQRQLLLHELIWRRKCLPTPVFLPGESHGQRNLLGYSPWGHKRVRHNWACTHI